MQARSIAVIGGTGKSGKYVVQQLQQHFQLHLLPRPTGNARNFDDIYRLLEGCQVVVSTLGQPKDEPPIFSDATRNILQAMQQLGIKRYIVTTGLSVSTPADHKNEQVTFATKWMYDNYPATTTDKQKEYDLLAASDIDWTLIRLPLIQQTEQSYGYHTHLYDCPGSGISATDIGKFMIDEIQRPQFIRQAPFLFNK